MEVFEHFIILEIFRLNEYFHKDFQFSYLQTQAGVEVDLFIERSGKPLMLFEIKSAFEIRSNHLSALVALGKEFADAELICLSQEKYLREFNDVQIFP